MFLHCNASNMVLKILQHDKIWGNNPPAPNSGGTCPPVPPWSTPMLLQRNQSFGETLDKVHFSCRRGICWKMTKYDVRISQLTVSRVSPVVWDRRVWCDSCVWMTRKPWMMMLLLLMFTCRCYFSLVAFWKLHFVVS